jgi:hypothetical protein
MEAQDGGPSCRQRTMDRVDPGTQPTGTPSTSTQATGTQLLVHKLLVHQLLVCRRKIGTSWTEEQGVLFDSAWKIQCC